MEETEREPVHDWTRWSHWAPCPHSVLLSSPHCWTDKGREHGAKAFVVILMSGRPDRMIFNVWLSGGKGGCSWSGRVRQAVG